MITLWRDSEGRARCSVPHRVVHSPTGIEWGYRGAGPYDLAYSLLCAVVGAEKAEEWAWLFKDDVVARIPRNATTYVIHEQDVVAWVEQEEARKHGNAIREEPATSARHRLPGV